MTTLRARMQGLAGMRILKWIGIAFLALVLLTGALLLVIANFILGAAVHTRALPGWVHEGTAWATLVTCLAALARSWRVLGDNNRLIAEAASRREDNPSTRPTGANPSSR